MKKRVYIIYTGGTIGMVQTQKGYAPQQGYLGKKLDAIEELKAEIMPEYVLHEYIPLFDSSNISLKEWSQIAKDIESNYHEYDGFVVFHGTDTMAYTASALSFMLEGLGKPVIITGAQIPLSQVRNDALGNIITALQIAAGYDIPEVCIYFNGQLFRGCRTVKTSTDSLDAFQSPNFPALARVGVNIEVEYNLIIHNTKEELKVIEFGDFPIAIVKIFPGIETDVLSNIMKPPLKGIIIEAFGTGNIPTRDENLRKVLQDAAARGVVIIVCTQCLKGEARIGIYEISNIFAEAGAVSGYDMTKEAALAKLYYLFSKGYETEEVKRLMEENIRGELSKN
ncbi:MAG: asparaginase [Clostridiales bacterium]|nr:asparaginase [Clostridiales bacterium]